MSQLTERLQLLAKTSRFPPHVVAELGDFLSGAPEEDLFRINPLVYAARHGLPERDAIDLFVHAARQGLCEFSWDVFCVLCGSVLRSEHALRNLEHESHCATCNRSVGATLDEAVEVAFTVAPAVRPIRFHRLNHLQTWDDLERVAFSGNRQVHPKVGEMFGKATRFAGVLAPGERRTLGLDLSAGTYRVLAIREHSSADFLVAPQGERSFSARIEDGSVLLSTGSVAEGAVQVEVANNSRHFQPLGIYHLFWVPAGADPTDASPFAGALRTTFGEFLSGKRLLTSQSFRDLFRAESISPGSSFDLREITFMFTDLKGSTELYDRIGDFEAYRLVREHFQILERVVADYEGAIVKTIGDAVMATFSGARKAVEAAVEMHDRMDTWNGNHQADDLLLKIGIHDGPCIAVDSNDRLDYFGQTVNMAARIQALAQARETYFSDSVYSAPGVGEYVRSRQMELAPVTTSLKGISGQVALFRMQTG